MSWFGSHWFTASAIALALGAGVLAGVIFRDMISEDVVKLDKPAVRGMQTAALLGTGCVMLAGAGVVAQNAAK